MRRAGGLLLFPEWSLVSGFIHVDGVIAGLVHTLSRLGRVKGEGEGSHMSVSKSPWVVIVEVWEGESIWLLLVVF